eukprot:Nk52_evm48s217 gene=Nk52_evmTU48s217
MGGDEPKRVKFYRNGDINYPGKTIIFNPRVHRNWFTCLEHATEKVRAPFGAIRKVCTPEHGHQVRSFDELENGESYVVCGTEKFKKLNYEEILDIRSIEIEERKKHPVQTFEIPLYRTDDVGTPHKNSRLTYETQHRITNVPRPIPIIVYRNGDKTHEGTKMLLDPWTMQSLEHMMSEITEHIHLVSGAVRKLYTVSGKRVHTTADIIEHERYVAVGNEKFDRIPYGQGGILIRQSKLKPKKKLFKKPTYIAPLPKLRADSRTARILGHNPYFSQRAPYKYETPIETAERSLKQIRQAKKDIPSKYETLPAISKEKPVEVPSQFGEAYAEDPAVLDDEVVDDTNAEGNENVEDTNGDQEDEVIENTAGPVIDDMIERISHRLSEVADNLEDDQEGVDEMVAEATANRADERASYTGSFKPESIEEAGEPEAEEGDAEPAADEDPEDENAEDDNDANENENEEEEEKDEGEDDVAASEDDEE